MIKRAQPTPTGYVVTPTGHAAVLLQEHTPQHRTSAPQFEAVPSAVSASEAGGIGRTLTVASKQTALKTKVVKPVPEPAFENRQLNLFQNFLANTDGERDSLSNAIDLWDSIPRYAISRLKMNSLRTAEGFLETVEIPFNYRGRSLTAVIHPARVKDKDDNRVSFYPSAREELIEHALRKIAADQQVGFFDQPDYRSGARFSLHALRRELEQKGHSLRYDEIIEGLDILSLATIEITGANPDGETLPFARSSYLSALAGVKRKDLDADPQARWVAQFHPLVTDCQ